MLALRRALEQPRSQHCYLRQQPRRAPPSAALPPRGPGRRGCSDPGRGGSTESEERAQGARGPGVSVTRAAEAEALAALGHRELPTPRIRRASGGDQPGPGAGEPSLGRLRASLGRLGRFELPPHPPGDCGGCTPWAAEDSDLSLEAKTHGSGPASQERARSRAVSRLDLGRLI